MCKAARVYENSQGEAMRASDKSARPGYGLCVCVRVHMCKQADGGHCVPLASEVVSIYL